MKNGWLCHYSGLGATLVLGDFWNQLVLPLGLALLSILLLVLCLWLLPNPWNMFVGAVVFILMVTGVLPILIHEIYKKSRSHRG
jgi:hypothetical protein